MNRDINPVIALIIIALVICPLVLWGWASGERALSVAGSFYLEETPSKQLSIQVDHLLVLQNEPGKDAILIDLEHLGVESPKGNVSYFRDGDLLVRAGRSANSLAVFSTMKEAMSAESAAKQQELGEMVEGEEALLKCNLDLDQCNILGSLRAPWHHRLFIDPAHQFIHVVDGLGHEVRSYNQYGMMISSFKSGLRYPKRIRCHADNCYVIDTNNQRVLFLTRNESGGFKVQSELTFEALGDDYKWIIDAYNVYGKWWVISADNSMRSSKVHIFDQNGRFQKRVKIPEEAEPFDLLLRDNEMLISDIATGRILRFKLDGMYLDNIESDKVNNFYASLKAEQEKYDLYIYASILFLALLILIGFSLFVIVSRKSNTVGDSD